MIDIEISTGEDTEIDIGEYAGTFCELYEIRYDYLKSDGYWVYSKIDEVYVRIKHGDNEKANHDLAREIFQRAYPSARILSVNYC